MTVISAGIINKQGKIILSRQFTDVSRIRIEGLLSAFPKLLVGSGTNSSSSKQCTYVEAGAVRYVYQPVENLLLVLVTTKNSNIVEDLATLRLMGQLIPEYVNNVDEETVANKAFELLFAFDEVIVSGKREHNTLEQIMTYLEMQSHEEEVAKEEKKLQMELAKKEASRRAREITQKRRENGYGGIGSHGSGRGGSGAGGGHYDANEGDFNAAVGQQDDGASRHFASVVEDAPKQAPKPKSVGGMSLGRARKADITSKVLLESNGGTQAASSAAAAVSATSAGGADAGSSAEGIFLRFEEKISCTINRDGGASNVDVSGCLNVTITDAQLANVRLLLGRINDDFNFRTHPNINKNLFTSDRVLTIKDGKPFPTHQSLSIVKWRLQNPGRVRAPITVTCWPGSDAATVEFELENLQATLLDVTIVIPLGGVRSAGAEPSVGTTSIEGDNLQWSIPVVDSGNSSGSCEISLAGEASDASFFPIQIFFQAKANIAGVTVAEAVGTETGMPVRFSSETILIAEDYIVN